MIHSVSANGASIPAIGLGTWDLRGGTCVECVKNALDGGYRHIDTAAMYDNEEFVGEGMRASVVSRDEIFLTTKVWPDNAAGGDFQKSVEDSLSRLGLDYADLILLHWPNPDVPVAETMKALCDVKKRGLAKHIGVSNYTTALLEEAVAASSEPLAVNQVEYHPYLDQRALLIACAAHGIALTAYSPLAKGRVFSNPVLMEIGSKYDKSAGQVALRWLVQQKGVVAIPRSSRPERIAEALAIADFKLSDNEMSQISALSVADERLVNLTWAPDWDGAAGSSR